MFFFGILNISITSEQRRAPFPFRSLVCRSRALVATPAKWVGTGSALANGENPVKVVLNNRFPYTPKGTKGGKVISRKNTSRRIQIGLLRTLRSVEIAPRR
jgi:hypothetical protein